MRLFPRHRCVTPINDSDSHNPEVLCGARATEVRLVEEIECPLCAEHAAELDAERGGKKKAKPTAHARTRKTRVKKKAS